MINMRFLKEKVGEFKRRWKREGVDEVEIKEFTTWEGSSKHIINLADKNQLSTPFRKKLSYPCLRPWHRVTILWDGRVVPCCFDYDGKYICGDLNKESLQSIWNNCQMKELRRQHIENDLSKNDLCKNCREKAGMPKNIFYPFSLNFIRRGLKLMTSKL